MKLNAGTAPSKWVSHISEQHQQKSTNFYAQLAFFWCKWGSELMLILVRGSLFKRIVSFYAPSSLKDYCFLGGKFR